MPLNFDSDATYASPPAQNTDDMLADYGNDHSGLISELKLSLIGNFDLKNRLLADGAFAGWFRNHLRACVEGLMGSDVLGTSQGICEHNSANIRERANINNLDFSNDDSLGDLKVLTGLNDALVVLRLLLVGPKIRAKTAVSSSKQKPFFSAISYEKCIPELIKLMEVFNKAITAFPSDVLDQNIPSPKWEALSASVCDTVLLVLELSGKSKNPLSSASLQTLWASVSTIFGKYAGSNYLDSVFLTPMACSVLELVPLLLQTDLSDHLLNFKKYAEVFFADTTRYVDHRLGTIVGVFPGDSTPSKDLQFEYFRSNLNQILVNTDFSVLRAAVVAMAQVSNYFSEAHQENGNILNILGVQNVHQCLIPLLHVENAYVLNVAALNLIHLNLKSGRNSEKSGKNQENDTIHESIFPRIVELLKTEKVATLPRFLKTAIGVLSELCLEMPSLCARLKNTNVDRKITQDMLALFDTSPVFSYIQALKGAHRPTKKLADFTGLNPDMEVQNLGSLASHLLLLGAFTGSNEEFRRRVTAHPADSPSNSDPSFLCHVIFEIVENYHFLCSQILLNYRVLRKLQNAPQSDASNKLRAWLGENAAVIISLLENPINSNAFFLVRSLSRSVSTVRTFFVDCNSIKSSLDGIESNEAEKNATMRRSQWKGGVLSNIDARYDREAATNTKGNFIYCLLRITSYLGNLDRVVPLYTSPKEGQGSHTSTVRSLFGTKVVIIACLANFILDFGSFRYEIVNHEKTFRDLAGLFTGASVHNIPTKDVAYEHLKVQLGILQVIENYLYNENEDNRKVVWEYFPLSMIFELSLYGTVGVIEETLENHKIRVQQKVMAFGILRNLTAASSYFSEAMEGVFAEFAAQKTGETCPETWGTYLVANLLSFDLFVDLDVSRESAETSFMEDDEFVLRLLQETEYVKLIVAINYLEDHRYTNIAVLRESNFPPRQLLRIWKRLLTVNFSKTLEQKMCGSDDAALVRLSNNVNEVKVSICWVLINLTWDDDHFGGTVPEDTHFRLMDIVSTTSERSRLYPSSEPSLSSFYREDDESEGSRPPQNGAISMKTRAKVLYKFGFFQALDRICLQLLNPQLGAGGAKDFSLSRFDSLNSNDLYEKCKTAQHQISALLTNTADSADASYSASGNREHVHPLRRLSGNANSDGSNLRGNHGEGAVWSDEADRRGSSDQSRGENRGGNERQEPVQDDDEEIDEYWIR